MKALAKGVLAFAVLSLPTGCGVGKLLELEAPGGKPALMTGVLVTREGGGYKIQYSLQDKDLAYTSSDGTLTVWFVDYDEEATRYFQKYQTLLGGEVWGHLIILSGSEVSQYGSDIFATMKLRFETAKGAVFEDEDTFFL